MAKENLKGQKPLIIVGMHRSGTSMLSRYIDEIGYFTGVDKQRDNESEFFIEINNWVLSQYNATWDNPYNYKFSNDHMDKHIENAVAKRLNSVWLSNYLGFKRYFNYRTVDDFDFKWGWKDPRNSFTLGLWKKIFGDLKVIHIYRHPMDIALSLKQREEVHKNSYKKNMLAKLKETFLRGKVGYQLSTRVEHFEEGYKLWNEYTNSIFDFEKKHKNVEFLHIKYEDFLDDPKSVMIRISEYLEIPVDIAKVEKFEKKINSNNKNKFKDVPQVLKFYEDRKNDDLMIKLGYN